MGWRKQFKGRQFADDLALARGDGRHPRLIKSLGRADLLILDDFGLEPLDAGARHDLLKSSRSDTAAGPRSSPSASLAAWHDVIGDPTYADAILDRLVHNAHRINSLERACAKREANKPKRLTKGHRKEKKTSHARGAPGGITVIEARHHPGIPGRNHPVIDGRPSDGSTFS